MPSGSLEPLRCLVASAAVAVVNRELAPRSRDAVIEVVSPAEARLV